MLLNSYIFIFVFLPLLGVIYFTCNKIHITAGKIVLILGSLIFYAYADWHMLFFLLASVSLNYLSAYLMRHEKWKKVFLAVPVVINVGLLLFFKYTNFMIENFNAIFKTNFALLKLLIPMGISFITFQQIAYLVTVYRGDSLKSEWGGGNKENRKAGPDRLSGIYFVFSQAVDGTVGGTG